MKHRIHLTVICVIALVATLSASGYSSNKEAYPDGRQIHAPILIPKETVRSIDLVLGCVTKEYSDSNSIV